MKLSLRPVLLAITLILSSSAASAQSITFADVPTGALPPAFEPALTGKGAPGRWEVVPDGEAAGGKALAQLSTDPTSYRFPLAVHTAAIPADVVVEVRFKAMGGRVDQAGGIAIRLGDLNNYYVVRANALENNVRFYRVVDGRREQIAGADVAVSTAKWHDLKLTAKGNRFTISFDGKDLFSANDDRFPAPGKVALWTKADSVTRFDRLVIAPLD